MSERLKWRIKRDKQPGGDELWTGFMEIPTLPGNPNLKLKATEATPAKAMSSITKQATSLLKNPFVKAIVPAQALAALSVAKKIISNGGVKKALKAGKKAIKFAKSLKFW